MPTDAHCAQVERRLEAAFWSRVEPAAADLDHADRCDSCGEFSRRLRGIAAALSAASVPAVDDRRALEIRRSATRALVEASPRTTALLGARLPDGYLRELFRILGWATLPLPLALLAYAQMFHFGGALLGRFLPDWSIFVLGSAAACGAASWLAFVYGSIPFVAYRRVTSVGRSTHSNRAVASRSTR